MRFVKMFVKQFLPKNKPFSFPFAPSKCPSQNFKLSILLKLKCLPHPNNRDCYGTVGQTLHWLYKRMKLEDMNSTVLFYHF